jgi:hypothetical protein
MFTQVLAISALAASASAHMVMRYPTPFGVDTLNTSPLAPADFPCKQRNGVYAIDSMNQWDAGQTQSVSFNGTAVHGGGSCQFSITTDPEPTENSQWKVIQSNIGNCPSDADGNLPEPKDGVNPAKYPLPNTFPVTMPKNIPDGRYTFAWTWMNKLGNREFYMNCAPVQVGSASGKASTTSAAQALSALPDMFVINLPYTDCSSKADEDFAYPNPGKNVVTGKKVTLGSTTSGAGCTKMNAMGAGAGSIGSPSEGTPSTPDQGTPSKSSSTPSKPSGYPAQSAAPSASPINKGPGESPAPISPGGVFAPGASSAPAAAPTVVAPKPAQPSAPAAKPVPSSAPSAAPQTPSNSTPSNGDCTPCTNDGAVVCMGSKQFGLCNRGCAVAQDLALGMTCTNGAVVASTKRHLHFPRAHLHRRLSAARML